MDLLIGNADGRVGQPPLFFVPRGAMGIGFDPTKRYCEIIDRVAAACGYTVYDRSVRLKGENTKIAVKIDSINGVMHSDCERFSRELSLVLEEDGSLSNFMLEISSPGLDRKLVMPEDFVRFIGSPVKVIYENNGGKVAKGKLIEADHEAITVDVIEEKQKRRIPLIAIKGANLDF
jgi:ribosome maturation factor RimP